MKQRHHNQSLPFHEGSGIRSKQVSRRAKPPEKWSLRVDMPLVRESPATRTGSSSACARRPRVYGLCRDLQQAAQEAFIVIDLNAKNNVIDKRLVTLGLLDASLVHPREVFPRRDREQRAASLSVTTTRRAIRRRARRMSASPGNSWTPAASSQSALSITSSSAGRIPPAPAPPRSSVCAKPAWSSSPSEGAPHMNIIAAHKYVSPRARPLTPEEAEVRRLAYALKIPRPRRARPPPRPGPAPRRRRGPATHIVLMPVRTAPATWTPTPIRERTRRRGSPALTPPAACK